MADRIDAFINQWQNANTLDEDDMRELINGLIARLGDLCSGPHLALASTDELVDTLIKRAWNEQTHARVLNAFRSSDLSEELRRRRESLTIEDAVRAVAGFSGSVGVEYPATPAEAFVENRVDPTPPVNLEHLEVLAERREDVMREMLGLLRNLEGHFCADRQDGAKTATERVLVDDAWIDATALRASDTWAKRMQKMVDLIKEPDVCLRSCTRRVVPCDHDWRTFFPNGAVVVDPYEKLPKRCRKCGAIMHSLT